MRFLNTVAVVTGGGSGIGKAAALRLAKEGAAVVLVGRTAAKLEEAAEEIARLGTPGALTGLRRMSPTANKCKHWPSMSDSGTATCMCLSITPVSPLMRDGLS
nr:SDR family NAD(P)-dependent oxidoreductase [Geobacillus sp. JS12]